MKPTTASLKILKISLLCAAATTASACDESSPQSDAGTEGIEVPTSGASAGEATTEDIEPPGDEESSSGGQPLPPSLDCDKIDFLFVIDNSSSMADEQQHLVAAVPGFVDAMRTALPNVESLRVGVIDTDSYPSLGTAQDALNGCPEDSECDSCDYQLGALLDKPGSAVDPESSCGFSSGERYMDGHAESFPDEFECVALVGVDGNPIEQQASALVNAVSGPLAEDGGCNDGFVRDDALLVFVVISDEEDDHAAAPGPQGGSMGEPELWYDALVQAKGGEENNVVGLGLIGGSPRFSECEALSSGLDGAEQTTRLDGFLGNFNFGFTGSVCAEGYDAFFSEALDEVAKGCSFFIP